LAGTAWASQGLGCSILIKTTMKLIRLNNYEIEADDELLLLKPFRKLFNQDRSGSKKNFYDFLMVLYFTYDLRSDF
jgi:hypothetical protein